MSTENRNKRSALMSKAWEMAKSLKISFKQALAKAWKWLKNQSKVVLATTSAFFEITFTKVSTGEVTTRIASNGRVKGDNLLFFSISDNGFRSAVITEILEVKSIEGVELKLI
jgi:hypothetical protein